MAGQTPTQKIREAGGTPLSAQPDKATGRSVTLQSLQERYGEREGRRVYYEVALAGGFGDFRGMASTATPPLDLTGLDADANAERKAVVEKVLADADAARKVEE